ASDPAAQRTAAVRNDAVHPYWPAIQGVSDAVTAPPICAPMFMTPETVPADEPARSALTDQHELCARYSAPAPPARTMLAISGSAACVPSAMKMAATPMPTTAIPQRPMRLP